MLKVTEQAQEASYLVLEITAKEMKPHTIGESLFHPDCAPIERAMFDTDAEEEIQKIPIVECYNKQLY
jgi:hypothetical protein